LAGATASRIWTPLAVFGSLLALSLCRGLGQDEGDDGVRTAEENAIERERAGRR
jgi:hypothetical protein